mgnify:CR=1 FL=1
MEENTIMTLLEKASARLAAKAGVWNLDPESMRVNTALSAMKDILKYMDFEIDFEWSENKIISVIVSYGNEKVEKAV